MEIARDTQQNAIISDALKFGQATGANTLLHNNAIGFS